MFRCLPQMALVGVQNGCWSRFSTVPTLNNRGIPPRRCAACAKRNWKVGDSTPAQRPGNVDGKRDDERYVTFLGGLFFTGATVGTLLNAIPSQAGMLHYDAFPIQIMWTDSSLLVPPFMGAFYVVIGGLFPLLDSYLNVWDRAALYKITWEKLILSFAALTGMFQITALMYHSGVPYWAMSISLCLISVANWELFDGTTQGLILGALCGMGVELIEAPLLDLFHPWHYMHPDMAGVPSFLIWCNVFYTPFLANLSRKLFDSTKS
ncbi:hypothetical protein BSKO_07781 [Bryopsis sp. KO-2023]|nr:hypothetical protein BSKO_07781 [Bryopsis sp. KO-2023]